MERWTHSDEAALRKMQERKKRILEASKKPLYDLVLRLRLDHSANHEILDILVTNADAFRDALEPFDSGVRCAPET